MDNGDSSDGQNFVLLTYVLEKQDQATVVLRRLDVRREFYSLRM